MLKFSLSSSPVTRTEITDAIAQLQSKKSEDMFGLSMCTLKKLVPALIEPLYSIIYKSFEKGIFPSQLKIAKIVPVFKGTGTQDLIWLKVVSLDRSWLVGLTDDL